ncbi:hypothetical protein PMAYCL1PPCAC_01477, partial [Pristionchus mayeri]
AENRRLNERLDEANLRIESLNGEKLNLEQEWKNTCEEASEAVDVVRRRLEEMERSAELKDKKVRELEDENLRLNDSVSDSKIAALQSKETKKVEEQNETINMTESKLKADVTAWHIWYEDNRAYFGSNVRMPPIRLNWKPVNVHIPPPRSMEGPYHGGYQSMPEHNHMGLRPLFEPNNMPHRSMFLPIQGGPGVFRSPPPSFNFQTMPSQPRPPDQFDMYW